MADHSLCRLSAYVVGEDALQQIEQLKELNLGGELSIRGLENVKGLEDAQSANLMTKKDLTSLEFYWTEGLSSESPEHCDEVLQGLKPHQNIERVSIYGYPGSKFPEWVCSSAYNKLKRVTVRGCRKCEHLPPLGKLHYLTSLLISGFDSVKRIGAEWYGDGERPFPQLTELHIYEMLNLEEWSTPDSVESFPCLTEFHISGCSKLGSLPSFPSLRHLEMFDAVIWSLVAFINNLTLLESLELELDRRVDDLPGDLLQNNKALQFLQISGWSIKSLSNMLDNLSGLKTLRFYRCASLESLPDDLSSLKSLERLEFFVCGSLTTFPVSILEGLPSLSYLRFLDCEKLEHLSGPLNLAAPPLHCLDICGLPTLQCLPESLLKSLRKLRIRDCPVVEKRCEKPNGEDWPKISHIPTIEIIQGQALID